MSTTSKAVALALMIALAVGCGGRSIRGEAPEKAVERQLHQVAEGHADDNYKELHPAQQAIIPEDLFRQCAVRNDIDFISIKVKAVSDADITIPGTTTRAAAKVVTMTIDATVNGTKVTQTPTFHVILVKGAWRFILNNVAAYKLGACPS